MVTRGAVLVTAFGTAIAGRNEHVYRRTVCDVQVDSDIEHSEDTRGSAAIQVPTQKQDRVCRGHTARIAAGPLVRQLQKWMAELDLRVSPHCEKAQPGANPRAKCRFCPPLFPKHLDGRRNKDGLIEPMRPQAVSDCVKLAMKAIGVDAKRISGRSMRRGGIPAARLAGVAEDLVYIQSCHGQHRVHDAVVDDTRHAARAKKLLKIASLFNVKRQHVLSRRKPTKQAKIGKGKILFQKKSSNSLMRKKIAHSE